MYRRIIDTRTAWRARAGLPNGTRSQFRAPRNRPKTREVLARQTCSYMLRGAFIGSKIAQVL